MTKNKDTNHILNRKYGNCNWYVNKNMLDKIKDKPCAFCTNYRGANFCACCGRRLPQFGLIND